MRLSSLRPVRATTLALTAVLAAPLATGLATSPAFGREAPASFADLAAELLPGVVNVSSSQSVAARGGEKGMPEIPNLPPSSPFEQFFHDFMERNRPGNQGGGGWQRRAVAAPRKMQSLGSGFIIDPSGIVVTNNHVIDGADEITITLHDSTSLKATLVGRDERTDIAVLKVKTDKPLPAVQFGDFDASARRRLGAGDRQPVRPGRHGDRRHRLRPRPRHPAGAVRRLHPDRRGDQPRQLGRAAVRHGRQVIGMNTAIYSPSGGSIGIGFAIPSNIAKNVVEQLKYFSHARRGWLGVRIQQVTPDIAESLGLKDASGAMVAGVNDGGPADKAHIHNGDIILKFNNQDVKEMRNLPRIVADAESARRCRCMCGATARR